MFLKSKIVLVQTITAVDHPMPSLGAGRTRSTGIRVEDDIQPSENHLCLVKDLSTLMDLETYSEQDYFHNGWVIFGIYACRNNVSLC